MEWHFPGMITSFMFKASGVLHSMVTCVSGWDAERIRNKLKFFHFTLNLYSLATRSKHNNQDDKQENKPIDLFINPSPVDSHG
jgi:hypothetical protein